MKKIFTTLLVVLYATAFYAQDDAQASTDSIENSFTYEHGKIALKNGIGQITIPQGFKYLNPEQAKHVLVDLWGNPESDGLTMGLILPENQGVMGDHGYVFNIQYDEIGYVKDDDAEDIDYDELLAQDKKDTEEDNINRKKEGYEPINVIGWASAPYYDKERKILHWAKELQFGKDSLHTLNYNVRILGRKGVLVLNAIASMPDLPQVKKDIPHVLNIVQFNKGYKYEEFDSSVDEVAAWTIGGLVAGKVLAKVGFFAVIAKFGKVIGLAVIGFFTALWKRIKGKKKDDFSNTSRDSDTQDS